MVIYCCSKLKYGRILETLGGRGTELRILQTLGGTGTELRILETLGGRGTELRILKVQKNSKPLI